MSTVRLVQEADLPALLALSARADPQVYTLPRTEPDWVAAIERSMDAAARAVDVPMDEQYFLVLQTASGQLGGVAALRATAGAQGTFFALRNDVVHHVSPDLSISNNVHVLSLSSHLTGYSQMSSFFLDAALTDSQQALLLLKSRLALAATDRARFSQHFCVALAGRCDAHVRSPFWDALGRHFFGMDFLAAERAVAGSRNRTLIAELMPHYPVYVSMLPAPARESIGQLHDRARFSYEALTQEGFDGEVYVDIFDGGPILEAHASKLRTLASAQVRVVGACLPTFQTQAEQRQYMVASSGSFADFRCAIGALTLHPEDGTVALSSSLMVELALVAGDHVMVCAL